MNFLTMDIVTEEGQIYLKHNGLKVPVPADMAVGLKDYPKDKVLMGIRPQDVHLADEARMIENPGWVFALRQ